MLHSTTKANKSFAFTLSWLERLKPGPKLKFFTDAKQSGLQLSISPGGTMTFWYRYRQAADGGDVPTVSKRESLGRWPELSLETARDMVRRRQTAKYAGDDAPPEEVKEMTLRELYELWYAGAKVKKRTIAEDVRKFESYCGELHDRPIAEITVADLNKFRDQIGTENGETMANRVLALLQTLFGFAIDDDDVPFTGSNPVKKVDRYSEYQRERYMRDDEIRAFWVAIEAEPPLYRHLFAVAALTGARIGNVREMRWEQLNLDRGTWHIPSRHAKAKKQLLLVLVPEVLAILRCRRAEVSTECPWVFPARMKKRLQPVGYPKLPWERVLERSGLQNVRMHDLRRTLATLLAQSGVSEMLIGKVLGHAHNSTATRTYTQFDDTSVRRVVEGVAAQLLTLKPREGGES